MSNKLLNKNLVTMDFLVNLISREKEFPTGMDMSVINPNLPNIAIPHTEVEYVKTCAIIPIKLLKPIKFFNMINPNQELDVSYLFMILNDNPNNQAGMLANIMDFMVKTDAIELQDFFNLTNNKDVCDFLNNNFNKK
ncbi:MAG: PTS sugar transporter subunit IIA [Vagococcus sp.]